MSQDESAGGQPFERKPNENETVRNLLGGREMKAPTIGENSAAQSLLTEAAIRGRISIEQAVAAATVIGAAVAGNNSAARRFVAALIAESEPLSTVRLAGHLAGALEDGR